MRTSLDQDDVEVIAKRVVEMITPLISQKEENGDVVFSVEKLAEYLSVSAKWVYDHSHELPHFKLGGLLRFRKREIDKIIDSLLLKVRLNKSS